MTKNIILCLLMFGNTVLAQIDINKLPKNNSSSVYMGSGVSIDEFDDLSTAKSQTPKVMLDYVKERVGEVMRDIEVKRDKKNWRGSYGGLNFINKTSYDKYKKETNYFFSCHNEKNGHIVISDFSYDNSAHHFGSIGDRVFRETLRNQHAPMLVARELCQ